MSTPRRFARPAPRTAETTAVDIASSLKPAGLGETGIDAGLWPRLSDIRCHGQPFSTEMRPYDIHVNWDRLQILECMFHGASVRGARLTSRRHPPRRRGSGCPSRPRRSPPALCARPPSSARHWTAPRRCLPTFDVFRVVWRVAALATPTAGVRLPPPGVPVAIEGDTDIARAPTAFGCGSLPGRDRRRRGGVVAARGGRGAGGAVPDRALFTAACPTRGPGPCSAEPSVNVRAGGRTSAAVTAEHAAMSTTVACRSARS